MIKVFVITEEGRGGGPLNRIRLMANELRGSIETVVVAPRSGKSFIGKLKKDNIPFHILTLHPLTRSLKGCVKYIFYFLFEIYSLYKLFKKENPEIIHVNGSWQIKGLLAGHLAGKKVVWHMNDTYQPSIIQFLFRLLYKKANAFIFASLRTKAYYEKVIGKKFQSSKSIVIPAPVDINDLPFYKREIRENVKLLSIGYINPHKGIENLIEAADILAHTGIHIDVVGPVLDSQKSYMAKLNKLANDKKIDNVSFLGYHRIDAAILSNYDYYLCSSLREASPMAVWEAMASGLPVISTPVGDLPYLMQKFSFGKLTASHKGRDIANSISEMIAMDQCQYEEMSLQARSVVSEYFSVEKVSKQYLRFYSNLIGEAID